MLEGSGVRWHLVSRAFAASQCTENHTKQEHSKERSIRAHVTRENHPVLSWKRSREMTSRQAGGDPERNKPRAAAGFSRNFQPVATSKEGILSVRKKSPLPRSVQRERAAASGEGWRRHTYAHVHTCTRTLAHLHRRTYCKHTPMIM